MMNPMTVALVLLVALAPLSGQAREVLDDSGHRVTVPDHPQRIVSLHDWVLTVMTRELNLPLAGTSARLTGEGHFYIRSAEELFGLTTAEVPLASVHGQTDPERIATLHPDLILASTGDDLPLRDQLAAVAPVLMLDPEDGTEPRAMYRKLAGWLGAEPRFEVLATAFDRHAAAIAGNWQRCSYLPLLVNDTDGTLTVARDYGGVTLAMEALGPHLAPGAALVPEGASRTRLSAEIAGSLTADILVLTYLQSRGETPDTPVKALEKVVPGFIGYLRAQGGTLLILPRERAYPISFRAATGVLEAAAAAKPGCAATG